MGNALGYGMTLNTGTYYGNGTTNVSNSSKGYNNRVASSTNINRVSRDIAQGYNQDIEVINLYLQQGDVDEALALYQQLFDDAKETTNNYGYQLTDSQISSIINQAFTTQTGNTFTGCINENTSTPFVTGLKNGIPILGWFLTQHDSDADALAKLSGVNVSPKATAIECAGGIMSGAASGAAIGGIIGNVPGAIIGGIIGGAAGLIRGLI